MNIKNKLATVMLSMVPALGFSSDINDGVITNLMFDKEYPNLVFLDINGTQTGLPACHSNSRWEYVLDASDALGEKMLSALLVIKASGGSALFSGTATCPSVVNVELLRRVEIK